MFSVFTFFLTLAAFNTIFFVNAGLYIVNPRRGSVCQGGKPCTVDWLDDGQNPLLSAIGVTTVGLYTGNQHLVQTIAPVDVSKVHSLTFIPLPQAGPNSDAYYISLISTTLKRNNSLPYAAFSPFFQLKNMAGSFDKPDPVATSSIAVPASIAQDTKTPDSNPILTTITVGALATTSTSAATPAPTGSSSSGSSSSRSPSSPSKDTTTTPTSATSSSASVIATPKSSISRFSTLVVPAASSSSASSSTSTSLSSTTSSSSSASSSPSSTSSSSNKTNGAAGTGRRPSGFGAVVFGLIPLGFVLF